MPVTTDELVAVIGPAIAERGYDLEDLTISSAGSRSRVAVTVDRDGGAELDALGELSRILSDLIDSDQRWARTSMILEVTSPGVDRLLTEPRHWRRAAGRVVEVMLRGDEPDVPIRLTARVGRLDSDQGNVELVEKGRAGPRVRTAALTDIQRARVSVEFSLPVPDELRLCGLDEMTIADRLGPARVIPDSSSSTKGHK